MIGWLKCFLGCHDWYYKVLSTVPVTKHRVCSRCGAWADWR